MLEETPGLLRVIGKTAAGIAAPKLANFDCKDRRKNSCRNKFFQVFGRTPRGQLKKPVTGN